MPRLMSIRYGPGTQSSGGNADAHSRGRRLAVSWQSSSLMEKVSSKHTAYSYRVRLQFWASILPYVGFSSWRAIPDDGKDDHL